MAAAAAAATSAVTPPDRLELMLLDAELRDIYRSASLRADGSSTRGRKTKHDTATRRWIDTVGFPLLAMGKLPEAHDLAMLRSGPRNGLRGHTLAARDACSSGVQMGGRTACRRCHCPCLGRWQPARAPMPGFMAPRERRRRARAAHDACWAPRWSQLHARDPRSKQLTAAQERGQQTLLEWARQHMPDAATRATAQRGRPPNYKLHFGDWKGWTPRQLLSLAASNDGKRQKAMREQKAKVPPGEYLLWLCGAPSATPFALQFPFHFYTWPRRGRGGRRAAAGAAAARGRHGAEQ